MLSPLTSHLSTLPLLATGGGGLSSVVKAFNLPLGAWLVLLAGAAAVGLAIMGHRLLIKRREHGKSRPFLSLVKATAGAVPQAVTDPAKRARLDDMRRNFEGGIEKFRSAGKNLYAIPWYLLVGEPGSGKTEAVRHCGVGFPPGLQDPQQGAGGTLSMNWWFTNHAVILDTAGRLLFEEVEPGSTSEWREFLKILKSARGNCPINGLLLVIPATSLLKDSGDAIEQKAGKIARQLDTIQRALDVRFPVFVVVTMADLIPGFRSFFNNIDDPGLQSQLMGWSNPDSLDTPFNPEHVEGHLHGLTERLKRRRLGLMLDPVNTDDPRERRTDQVDELFNFPEALQKLAPRLRRYLELVFVAGEWSPKPLFLRGIYFTSSMREGQELDIDLAEALGVEVETLPGGKVWDRERAYFLRDVFMAKVFREKGLVTRASSVTRQQRRRRLTIMGASTAVVLALLGLTWYFGGQFSRTVGDESAFWSSTSRVMAKQPPTILDPARGGFAYVGDVGIKEIEPRQLMREDLPAEAQRRAEKRIDIPAVFRPFAAVSGSISGDLKKDERRDAVRSILDATLLKPTINAARESLARKSAELTPEALRSGQAGWSDDDTRALAELIRLRTLAAGEVPSARREGPPLIRLSPLLAASLSGPAGSAAAPSDRDKALARAESFEKIVDWAYGAPGDSASTPWPPAFVKSGAKTIDDDATRAADALTRSLEARAESTSTLGALSEVAAAALAFKNAEDALLAAFSGPLYQAPTTSGEYARLFTRPNDLPPPTGSAAASWPDHLAAVSAAAANLDAALASPYLKSGGAAVPAAVPQPPSGGAGVPPASSPPSSDPASPSRARTAADELVLLVDQSLSAVLDQLPVEGAANPSPGTQAIRGKVKDARESIKARINDRAGKVQEALTTLAPVLAAGSDANRAYALRLALYNRAGAFLAAPTTPQATLPATLDAISADAKTAQQSLAELAKQSPSPETADPASRAARNVIAAATARRATQALSDALDTAPATPDAVADAVIKAAEALKADPEYKPERQPALPLTAMRRQEFDAAFNRAAAKSILNDWAALAPRFASESDLAVLDADALRAKHAEKSEAFRLYALAYLGYWGGGAQGSGALASRDEPLLRQLRINADVKTWAALMEGVDAINGQEIDINNQLRALGNRMRAAADAVPDSLGPDVVKAKSAARAAVAALLSDEHFVEGYDAKTERMIKTWRSPEFKSGGASARRVVLDAIRDEVVASRPLAAVIDTGVAYWNDLSLTAMTLLADQALAESGAAKQTLLAAKSAPLAFMECSGGGAPLERDQITAIATALSKVAGAEGLPQSTKDLQRLPDSIREQLKRLQGDEFFAKPDTKDWLRRLGTVMAALGDPARPVTIEVAMVLDRDESVAQRFSACEKGSTKPAYEGGFLFAELRAAGKSTGTRTINPGGDAERSRPFDGSMDAATGPVDLVFKTGERAADGAVYTLPSPWSLLAQATRNSPRAIETKDGWWYVPIVFNVKGVAYYQRIALKFTPALPAPADWPTAAAWPRGD